MSLVSPCFGHIVNVFWGYCMYDEYISNIQTRISGFKMANWHHFLFTTNISFVPEILRHEKGNI